MRIGFLLFITACSKYSSRSTMGPSCYNPTGECPADVDCNLDDIDFCEVKNKNRNLFLCSLIEIGSVDLLKKYLEYIKSNPAKYPPEKVISLIAGYPKKISGMQLPLLMRAVRLGHLEITKVLFETLQGYSLDACRQVFCLRFDSPTDTPELQIPGQFAKPKFTIIHQAIWLSNFELVKYLTNKYIEIEIKNQKAKDPLSFSESSNLKDLIVRKNKYSFALLDLALQKCGCKDSNSLKIWQHLLQDADIFFHMASQYRSVLHHGVQWGNSEGLKNMIDAIKEGVKTIKHCQDREIIDQILNLSDAHHRTLLHCAVLWRRFDIVEYLMALGASATYFNKADKIKISPLFIAISRYDLDMVEWLLDLEIKYAGEASLRSSINHPGDANLTPLHLAVSFYSTATLPYTTLRDLNQVIAHEPPFIRAETEGIIREIIQALLDVGADPYIRDIFDEAPLCKAAKMGNADLIALLLKARVDPCIPDTSGRTPLHKAAKAGNVDSVDLLLNAGANPLAEDVQRYTLLDVALKAIFVKPRIEHDQTGRIKTLALILDQAIIQEQSSGRAVGKKRYESNVPKLFKDIESIYKHGDHQCQRDLFNQELNNALLRPYGISIEIPSQSKGKRPCNDSRPSYPSLNKKCKRKNVQECGLSSSSGRTIGTPLDIP